MSEKENWYALLLSIVRYVNPDAAFDALAKGKVKIDPVTMVELKNTMSYRAIQRLTGFDAGAIHKAIKRYEKGGKLNVKRKLNGN